MASASRSRWHARLTERLRAATAAVDVARADTAGAAAERRSPLQRRTCREQHEQHERKQLQNINHELLTAVCGGDGWSAYNDKLAQDRKDVVDQYNQSLYYNEVNGHTDIGKYLCHSTGE